MANFLSVEVKARGAPAPFVDLCVELSSGQRYHSKTDQFGQAFFPDLPDLGHTLSVLVVPIGLGCWRALGKTAGSKIIIDCPNIADRGPLGWWHRAIGIDSVDTNRGGGVVVGIADRNFVPGEGLERLRILDLPGVTKAPPEQMSHGELVSRLIGNRALRANLFLGISPGVEVVFVPLRMGPEGNGVMLRDVSSAIFQLIRTKVDIINLSLGCEQNMPELETIIARARRSGILCIAAAGNEGRDPVSFPARYSACASVGAVGIAGLAPPGSLVRAAESLRRTPRRGGMGDDFYVPHECNFGEKIDVTAPGVGIVVSTPTIDRFEMSGTSFAAPIVSGALATTLSKDQRFLAMERNEVRSDYMMGRLRQMAHNLGMPAAFQGCGMVHV